MNNSPSNGTRNGEETDVSVIIINFNTFELTCRCIGSVYRHSSGIRLEIILVDNASTECDPDLFLQQFPGIILIKNSQNTGFAKGNNAGIMRASGTCILLLNSDTELMNNAIQIAFNCLQNKKWLAAVSVRLVFPDGSVQKQCERFPSISLLLAERLRLHKLLPVPVRARLLLGPYHDHASYLEPDSVWGTFLMFRKSLLLLLPGHQLNDDYFMYYEDTQWCMDFKKLGYRIGYEPSGIVMHYMGKSRAPRSELIVQSKKKFYSRNFNAVKAAVLMKLT